MSPVGLSVARAGTTQPPHSGWRALLTDPAPGQRALVGPSATTGNVCLVAHLNSEVPTGVSAAGNRANVPGGSTNLGLQRRPAGPEQDEPQWAEHLVASRVEPGKSHEWAGGGPGTGPLIGRRLPNLVLARVPSTVTRPDGAGSRSSGPQPFPAQPGSLGPAPVLHPGHIDPGPDNDFGRQLVTPGGWATAPGRISAGGSSYTVVSAGRTTLQRLGGAAANSASPVLSVPRLVHRSPPVPMTEGILTYPGSFVDSFAPALSQPPVTAAGSSGEPGPVGEASSTVQRAGGAPTGDLARPESGGPGPSTYKKEHGGDDLDDLSRRLYERIRDRLKAELYLDRERAGQLSDFTV